MDTLFCTIFVSLSWQNVVRGKNKNKIKFEIRWTSLPDLLTSTSTLIAFTGVTNAHLLSTKPTICRSPTCSQITAMEVNILKERFTYFCLRSFRRMGDQSGDNMSSPELPIEI